MPLQEVLESYDERTGLYYITFIFINISLPFRWRDLVKGRGSRGSRGVQVRRGEVGRVTWDVGESR